MLHTLGMREVAVVTDSWWCVRGAEWGQEGEWKVRGEVDCETEFRERERECVSVAARGVRIKALVIVTSSPKCVFDRVGALALI